MHTGSRTDSRGQAPWFLSASLIERLIEVIQAANFAKYEFKNFENFLLHIHEAPR